MKIILKLILPCTLLAAACNKQSTEPVPDMETAVRQITGNFLEFSDHQTFENEIFKSRNRIPTDRLEWERKNRFVSMLSRLESFNEKYKIMNATGDSTGYALMLQEYASSVIWPEKHHFDVNSPEYFTSALLNPNGYVKIGNTLYKMEYDRKIIFWNISPDIIRKAEAETGNVNNENYRIEPVTHPEIIDKPDQQELQFASYPNYTWLDINHAAPAEGGYKVSHSNTIRQTIGNFSIQVYLEVITARKDNVLYGYVSIMHRAFRRGPLGGDEHVFSDLPVVNGGLCLFYTFNGAAQWMKNPRYNNTNVHDYGYANQFFHLGRQIIAASEKYLTHPNPNLIPGYMGDFYKGAIQNYADNFRILVYDTGQSGEDLQSYGTAYNWVRFKSGSILDPSVNGLLRIEAMHGGHQFSINF